jgi:hypothetical protein
MTGQNAQMQCARQ